MPEIVRIVTPCIVQVSDDWKWRGLRGRQIRLSGLLPPDRKERFPVALNKMQTHLLGHRVRIVTTHFIETGPVLVADLDIEDAKLEKLFPDRYAMVQPRERILDTHDVRSIRPVKGRIPTSWQNPLLQVSWEQKPALGNHHFPTDPWLPDFQKKLDQVRSVYSPHRQAANQDKEAIKTFLDSGNHRLLIIFGDCGSGKSWFIREYLTSHPPSDTDIGFIDAIDFPRSGDNPHELRKRLHLRLSEILGEYVNSRPGGLRQALRPILGREANGLFPSHPFDSADVAKWCQGYLEELARPSNLAEYNWKRLASYSYSQSQKLLLVVDNLDGIIDDAEQCEVFQLVVETLTNRSGVQIIIPLRPSGRFMHARLNRVLQNLLKGHHLSPISMRPLLKKRLNYSETGTDLRHFTFQDGSTEEELSYADILDRYLNSESEAIVTALTGGDVRHYIRLFRRLLYSSELEGFANIDNKYYCIASLMLKPGERFDEDKSFVLNVFDNDHPNEIGNALIRWRVLEYFLNDHVRRDGDFFEYYFQRLGYDLTRVRQVIDLWVDAGALQRSRSEDGAEAIPTLCGHKYHELITNLWYCIVIKSGMSIDADYILRSDEARQAARTYGLSVPANAEWVSDDGFLRFLADEETLEEARLSEFQGGIPAFESACRSRGPKSIHWTLSVEYSYQLRSWERARKKS